VRTEDVAHEAPVLIETPLLSVVIPVYRSQAGLDELYKRLHSALDEITPHWEILFVDDCSPDDSWKKLDELVALDPRVRALQLMRNYGQQRAVLTGLAHSQGEFIVTMDDDLQHRPEEIRLLLDTIRSSNADVVIGRYRSKKHGLIRRLGTRVAKWLAEKTIGVPSNLSLTSFRIIRHSVAQEVSKIQHSNPVVGYLLFAVTRRFENVEVHHDPRKVGVSNYSLRDLVDYFLCIVTDYSDWPLRALGGAGCALSAGSFALGGFHLFRYFSGAVTVSGFTTIVLLLTTLSGFILIGLGIIGAYLLRILRRDGPDARVAIRGHLSR
jgi:dolichol-phosphate mannosyltransferase/undecaprenyl-phosphate 4-deoxy-4-formamido-L-arabinose transferase